MFAEDLNVPGPSTEELLSCPEGGKNRVEFLVVDWPVHFSVFELP